MKLVLENGEGKAVRTFLLEGEEGLVISRKDTKRVEIIASEEGLERLEREKVKFDRLGQVKKSELDAHGFMVGSGRLKLVEGEIGDVLRNETIEIEDSKIWYSCVAGIFLLSAAGLLLLLTRPVESAKIEQELKQQVVQIVKKIPVKQARPVMPKAVANQVQPTETRTVKPTSKTASIRRMGALAVFGSLKKGSQKGGVNLGAVNTTAGPGLGGTAGSGGVQTTLYGKGLVAAPLGPGSNMKGGGGYGTKGKGGGQAGYGKLSLVGSAGSATIPLGREALVEGGLDKDLINDVIMKNMGQVRFCYEQGLQGDPSLNGRVAIEFTIGASGQVKFANVQNTSLNSKLVEDCIVMRLKSWKFPLPQGGVDVKVSYPFVLRRAGQG